MNTVIRHIQYLIAHFDCVIVPGLGAFVAQRIPASFAADGSSAGAPRRLLGFNAILSHDDGLLIGSVARRQAISYDAARSIVRNDVDLLRRALEARRSVLIPRIGTLKLEASDSATISFMPYFGHDAMVNLTYTGLPDLALAPIVALKPAATPAILPVKTRHPSAAARVMRYAASVLLLLGIGFVGSTPIIVDSDNFTHASLAIPTPSAPKVDDMALTDQAPRSLVYAIADSDAYSQAIVPADRIADRTFDHYIIVASCPTRSGARIFISQHPEEPMDIIEADGRFRVFTAASNDFYQASQARYADPDFARRHPDAWIFSPAK